MQFINALKLEELDKQLAAYEDYAKVIKVADGAPDLAKKLEILLEGVDSWMGSGAVDESSIIGGKLNISNLEMWLEQAKKDPSFSPDVIRGWTDTLESYIRFSQRKLGCAKLFGNLLNEWLASGDSITAKTTGKDEEAAENEHFVQVGRKEMLEQKEKFNSIVFEAKKVDTKAIRAYLTDLFSDVAARKLIEDIHKDMEEFCSYLEWKPITADDVRWTIRSLLASDLMEEDKLEILREFQDNNLALDELASVLNMRLGSLTTWKWPESGLVITAR